MSVTWGGFWVQRGRREGHEAYAFAKSSATQLIVKTPPPPPRLILSLLSTNLVNRLSISRWRRRNPQRKHKLRSPVLDTNTLKVNTLYLMMNFCYLEKSFNRRVTARKGRGGGGEGRRRRRRRRREEDEVIF
jgi:hypothetical protein